MAGRREHVRCAAQPRAGVALRHRRRRRRRRRRARVHGRGDAPAVRAGRRVFSAAEPAADPAGRGGTAPTGAVREPLRGRRVRPREAVLVVVERRRSR